MPFIPDEEFKGFIPDEDLKGFVPDVPSSRSIQSQTVPKKSLVDDAFDFFKPKLGDAFMDTLPSTKFLKSAFGGARKFAESTPGSVGGVISMAGERAQDSQLTKLEDVAIRTIFGTHMGLPAADIASKAFAMVKKAKARAFEKTDIDEKLSVLGNKMRADNDKYLSKNFKTEDTSTGRFISDLGSGAASLASALAVGLLTRSAGASAAIFGLKQTGDVYSEGRKAGLNPDVSGEMAGIAGMAEAGLEFVGIDVFLKGIKGGAFARAIKGAATEFTQEFSQDIAESSTTNAYGVRKDKITDILSRGVYAGALGAITGAGAGVVFDVDTDLQDEGMPADKSKAAAVKSVNLGRTAVMKVVEPELLDALDEQSNRSSLPYNEVVNNIPASNVAPESAETGLEATISLDEMTTRLRENVANKAIKAGYSDLSGEAIDDMIVRAAMDVTGYDNPIDAIEAVNSDDATGLRFDEAVNNIVSRGTSIDFEISEKAVKYGKSKEGFDVGKLTFISSMDKKELRESGFGHQAVGYGSTATVYGINGDPVVAESWMEEGLAGFSVSKKYRRSGVATALIQEQIKNNGGSLRVIDANEEMLGVLKKAGDVTGPDGMGIYTVTEKKAVDESKISEMAPKYESMAKEGKEIPVNIPADMSVKDVSGAKITIPAGKTDLVPVFKNGVVSRYMVGENSVSKNIAADIANRHGMAETPAEYGKSSDVDLIAEAKKYKTAEEFVGSKKSNNIKYEDRKTYHSKIDDVTAVNPKQIRRGSEEGLEVSRVSKEVAESMDFSQPIEVSLFSDGELKVSDGNHRLAAAKQLGMRSIPVKLQAINAKGADINSLISSSDAQLTDIWNKAHGVAAIISDPSAIAKETGNLKSSPKNGIQESSVKESQMSFGDLPSEKEVSGHDATKEDFTKLQSPERETVEYAGRTIPIKGNSAIQEKFKEVGSVSFAGLQASPGDVAFAFRSLKNSAIEKGYVVSVKNGQISGVYLISLGGFGRASFDIQSVTNAIKDSDSAYMVHNHPSGNVQASSDDYRSTSRAIDTLNHIGVKLDGHVIIDDDKYGYIPTVYGKVGEQVIDIPMEIKSDSVSFPVMERSGELSIPKDKLLKVTSSKDVAEALAAIHHDVAGECTVMYLSHNNTILNASIAPNEMLTKRIILDSSRHGAVGVIVASNTMDTFSVRSLNIDLEKAGVTLLDVVSVLDYGSGEYRSMNDSGQIRETPAEYKKESASKSLSAAQAEDVMLKYIRGEIVFEDEINDLQSIGKGLTEDKERAVIELMMAKDSLADIDRVRKSFSHKINRPKNKNSDGYEEWSKILPVYYRSKEGGTGTLSFDQITEGMSGIGGEIAAIAHSSLVDVDAETVFSFFKSLDEQSVTLKERIKSLSPNIRAIDKALRTMNKESLKAAERNRVKDKRLLEIPNIIARAREAGRQRLIALDRARLEREYAKAAPEAAKAAGKIQSLKDSVGRFLDSLGSFAGDAFLSPAYQMSLISPKVAKAIERFHFNSGIMAEKYKQKLFVFSRLMKDLSPEDHAIVDLALKNRDDQKVVETLDKYGPGYPIIYQDMRNVFDDLAVEAYSVGLDFGFLADYWPRAVKNAGEYISHMKGKENWSMIERELKAIDPNDELSDEDVAQFINNYMRGIGGSGKISLGRSGNLMERSIGIVRAEENKYYHDSITAANMYISALTQKIEGRRLFGMSKDSIDGSVGRYITKMVKDGEITYKEEAKAKELLKIMFDDQRLPNFLKVYRDINYIYGMNSATSAIAQIEDLAMVIYQNGFLNSIYGFTHLKNVSLRDLGIDSIAEEFSDPGKLSSWVKAHFKMIGLDQVIRIGMTGQTVAGMKTLQGLALANDAKLTRDISNSFYTPQEVTQTLQELRDGKYTDRTKFLLFCRLLQTQPITKSSAPTLMAKNWAFKMLYQFKSFMAKRIEFFHQEIAREFQKGNHGKAIGNMVKLAALIMLFGMARDEVEDIILRRKTKLSDRVIDNILKTVFMTKYQIYSAKRDGIWQSFIQSFAPPAPFIFDVLKDIQRDTDIADKNIWGRIPSAGKFYYWWFGGGRTKELTKQAKELSTSILKPGRDKDKAESDRLDREIRSYRGLVPTDSSAAKIAASVYGKNYEYIKEKSIRTKLAKQYIVGKYPMAKAYLTAKDMDEKTAMLMAIRERMDIRQYSSMIRDLDKYGFLKGINSL